MAASAQKKLEVTYEEAAQRAPQKVRAQTIRMARRLQRLEDRIEAADINRQQVAYTYWQFRCAVEQTDTAIAAHRHVYNADNAMAKADLETMKAEYELAWEKWGEIFEQYPMLIETPDAEDLYEAINRYRDVMKKMDEEFPPPGFKLEPIVEFYDEDYVPVAKRKNFGKDGSAETNATETGDSSEATSEDSTDDTTPQASDEDDEPEDDPGFEIPD